MKVVTEAVLRELFRRGELNHFQPEPGQIVTPSAASFLHERQIKIISPEVTYHEGISENAANRPTRKGLRGAGDARHRPVQRTAVRKQDDNTADSVHRDSLPPEASAPPLNAPEPQPVSPPVSPVDEPKSRYVSALDGGGFMEKPEYMTHLSGNRLIAKDHPRIVFRGKLDSLQSCILLVQGLAVEKKLGGLCADLEEVLGWCRQIMKVDVLDLPLEKQTIFSLSPDELRQHSHYPQKHYGIDHITPVVSMGPMLLALNDLRSRVREVETAAVAAFRQEFTTGRTDILQALNRMSSAIYILMIREQAGYYLNP